MSEIRIFKLADDHVWTTCWDDGRMVAYLGTSVEDGEVVIDFISVAVSHRRRGIATDLLNSVREQYPTMNVNPANCTDMGAYWWKAVRGENDADSQGHADTFDDESVEDMEPTAEWLLTIAA